MAWRGDLKFLYKQLILKDFRIRYRNMSLGVFWSLLNPLVMMVVLTFVYTKIFRSTEPRFPVFVLCGIIPFNFFSFAWSTGTSSIITNATLIKRVGVPREVVPISTVLSSVPHLMIQLGLLMAMLFIYGIFPAFHWLWLLVIWALEIGFVCGLALLFSALNVFIKDTRYFVESANTVLFWLVPIFYPFSVVPARYAEIYQFNPVAAIVLAMRNILLEGKSPSLTLVAKLACVSIATIVIGHLAFHSVEKRFYEHL
jgi:ABC-type polysaccharide/polyol phosphate export permease